MPISRKTVLSRLIDSAVQPVYALDDKQRIVYCNEALASRLNASPDDLVGQVCEWVTTAPSLDDRQSLLNSLCPGPEVFLGHELASIIQLPEQRRLEEFGVRFIPFTESGKLQLVLAVVSTVESQSQPLATFHDEIRRIRARLAGHYDIEHLIGTSAGIQKVFRQAKIVAASNENVLISGPPGSGREQLARTIHYGGEGEPAPLVSLACHFLDDELLRTTVASLLQQQVPAGKLPALLLTDAHELVEEAQLELLRLISTSRFRVMATVARDAEGQPGLLSDVVDSVSTLTIDVPGLGQRPEDVRLLAEYFLERCNTNAQKPG